MPRKANGSPELRPLLIAFVRSKPPQTTIGELLADPLVGSMIHSLTVGEFGGETSSRGSQSPRPSKAAQGSTAGKPGRKPKANTRTAGGRGAYDEGVLAAIKSSKAPVAAAQVLKSVGGTGLQFRAATQRLLDAKKIKRTGKARGTRYVSA